MLNTRLWIYIVNSISYLSIIEEKWPKIWHSNKHLNPSLVAPAQPTSLRWNWGIFAQTCSTCLEGPYRKDSTSVHPCRAIDRVWEPRIPSTCSLKAITHATGSKIWSSRSCWNRGTEYYPVGMKTHIEYPNIIFWKYNSPYHIEMGTYVLIDLLW